MQNEIIIVAITALISSLVGWAVSQATVGRKTLAIINRMELSIANVTNEMKLAVERVSNDTHRAQDEINAVRVDITTRITGITDLVETVLDTANRLIEVVKIQVAVDQHHKE